MPTRNKIALMLTGVTSTNCGGAERFFCDFFSRYVNDPAGENYLYFFTDRDTSCNMESLGKLRTNKNLVILSNWSNRFKYIFEPLQFVFFLVFKGVKILQVTSYTESFLPRIRALRFLPAFLRPKLVITIVDCEIPYALEDPLHPKHRLYDSKYNFLFDTIKIDAVLSWYQRFVEFSKRTKPFSRVPFMMAVNSRYADIEQNLVYDSTKEPLIIWAARLTMQKQPLMLPQVVKRLCDQGFDFGKWRFEMYGDGEMKEEVENYIRKNRLEQRIKLMGNHKLDQVFSKSTCFISTQDYENFPSMSMMEAMHFGNVIISRNVGQTELMVVDAKNGYLLKEDSLKGLADTIKKFVEESSEHSKMMEASVKLTQEVHTYSNFRKQADCFWMEVMKLNGTSKTN